MADLDLSHIADIIKAAIPFVDSKLQGWAELAAKILDLIGSLNTVGDLGDISNLAANGFKDLNIDLEGMLKGVRPVCSIKEREIVDQILNVFNMKRMYETYNNMMSAMKTMQEYGGFSDSGGTNDAENVTSNFSGANFESIFKSFSNFTSPGSNNTSETYDSVNHSGEAYAHAASADIIDSEPEKATAPPPANSAGPMNNKMFDMLKTMVPPEQMSTFENLSMLFNTMSYDNNKPDDQKGA